MDLKKTMRYAVLCLGLTGCGSQNAHHRGYDLNGDGIQDEVTVKHSVRTGEFRVTAELSNSDKSYGKPKTLLSIDFCPSVIDFRDVDADRDLDIVYTGKRLTLTDKDTFYVLKNDGNGNFGKPEKLNENP